MNRSNFYIISFYFYSVKNFFIYFFQDVVIALRPIFWVNKHFFPSFHKRYSSLCHKQCNFYKISHFCIHVNTFCQKIKSSYLEDLISAEGGIWTLAPRKRSIPLAGAPLQPLEYFCKCLNINIFNCIRHSHDAWISYQSNFLLSIGFDWLF